MYLPNHTRVSKTYVPSSLLECNELNPVSELLSVSPTLSIDFDLEFVPAPPPFESDVDWGPRILPPPPV